MLTRLQRLDLLEARLKSDELLIVRNLASELGVSKRTLGRDIELLRERGLPIEADRGRGGGVRLHWSWGIGRINLSYREAVDLLVSLAVVEQLNSPILMANLGPIRRKLMASFSPKLSHEINRLKSRILIGQTASLFVQSGFTPPSSMTVERLHQAFLNSSGLEIDYTDVEGVGTKRVVEPHYLLLSYPVWYAICWDCSKQQARTFRCDRIMSATLVHDRFRLREIDDFRQSLEGHDFRIP
ncbi:MAG: WYL domain-containing protein [Pseudomonadota bacterium]